MSFYIKTDQWGCDEGYRMFQGYCYQLFLDQMDYADAEMKCQEENAILANPLSFTQIKFIESMMEYELRHRNGSSVTGIYLGLHKWDGEPPVWSLVKDGVGLESEGSFEEQCMIMSFEENEHKGFKFVQCGETFPFICQKSKIIIKSEHKEQIKCPYPGLFGKKSWKERYDS